MLELLAVLMLSILAVVAAVLGIGMAGSGGGRKPKRRLEGAREEIEEGIGKINGRTKAPVRVLAAAYTFLTEDTGKGEIANAENALKKGREAGERGLVGLARDYLLGEDFKLDDSDSGKDAVYISRGFGPDPSKYDTARTEMYLPAEEYNVIYRELLGSGETLGDAVIKEKGGPRDKKGRLLYEGKVDPDIGEITIEKYMSRGEKKNALHHELIEYKLRKEGDYTNEGDVERRVWEHYMKNPMEHLEEISASIRHYKELEETKKALFEEIKKENPEGMKLFEKYFLPKRRGG